jgi:hypothetical protein
MADTVVTGQVWVGGQVIPVTATITLPPPVAVSRLRRLLRRK